MKLLELCAVNTKNKTVDVDNSVQMTLPAYGCTDGCLSYLHNILVLRFMYIPNPELYLVIQLYKCAPAAQVHGLAFLRYQKVPKRRVICSL